eukprot:1618173-Rhodomonas_salina.1
MPVEQRGWVSGIAGGEECSRYCQKVHLWASRWVSGRGAERTMSAQRHLIALSRLSRWDHSGMDSDACLGKSNLFRHMCKTMSLKMPAVNKAPRKHT